MTSITLKNIPPELYERLKEAAEAHRRSLNREVIACLEQVVRAQRVDPEALIARARRLRELTEDYTISDDETHQAKEDGRP